MDGTTTATTSSQWTPMTPERHAHIHATKSSRMHSRRERVRRALSNPDSPLSKLSQAELSDIVDKAMSAENKDGDGVEGLQREEHQWIRRAGLKQQAVGGEGERRLWGGHNYDPYTTSGLASEVEYYDKWQQAYRFLGGYIDCDFGGGGGSHDNGGDEDGACARWMMWAAYIDPNYAGGGYDEYFSDDAPGALDCHSPDTDWQLIGVYRQEFYQFIEQISKHMWAIDEYEYIVALAGLEYMTDDDCFGVGYDENGEQLYAGVQPLEGGRFQMGLYSDGKCITPNTRTSYTYDDFAEKTDLNLGSKDQTNDDAFHQQAYQYWYATQEYTLDNLNTVYNDFRFCTSCVDYPTYQDGYFIGDDGTDDDDLINQCWKFYSHDSFNCDADCIAMGSQQGSITWINYNGKQFGALTEGQYTAEHDKNHLGDYGTSSSTSYGNDHKLERLKANLFLTVAGIVFVATFLAFAVARGSSKKKAKSTSRSRSRRLLDSDYQGERRSSRSASRSRKAMESDARSSKSRSKSRSGAVSSSANSRSKSRSRRSAEGEYVPPSERSERRSSSDREASERRKQRSQSRSKGTSGSSSRRDDF
eukprot:scaffold9123_cov186-Alexandrium_tamarense.AAC.2